MIVSSDINRRNFLKVTCGSLATLGVKSLTPPVSFAKEKNITLRLGYLPITDATPLLIAYDRKFFQEEGLNVEPPVRVRRWSALTESFLTNKFNLTHMLFPIPIWMRFNRKFPIKVLAWNHMNGSAITVKADANILTFKDLGGRQIAVPYWYSMHNIILQMGLKKVGLKPVIRPQTAPLKPDQVNLFILPPPEMPSALVARKIDGYIVAEPFNAIAEMKIGAKILRFTGDIWKNHPCCVVVMNENKVKSNPIFTQKVINAIVKAQLWIKKNPHQTAKILSKDGGNYLPVSEKILSRVFTGYEQSIYGKGTSPQAIKHKDWEVERIGFQPYPYPSATEFIIKEMRNTLMEGDANFLKRIQADLAARDLVDDTFVKHAIQNIGGLKQFDPAFDISNPFSREETVEL
ncbi:ABC transporter substrate-binding protein [Candidatus Magnetomorum sp. HK-1]|nr:ABC transporter substrate-binding protein [Candidatus Magnetomorum sp. HK-1]